MMRTLPRLLLHNASFVKTKKKSHCHGAENHCMNSFWRVSYLIMIISILFLKQAHRDTDPLVQILSGVVREARTSRRLLQLLQLQPAIGHTVLAELEGTADLCELEQPRAPCSSHRYSQRSTIWAAHRSRRPGLLVAVALQWRSSGEAPS